MIDSNKGAKANKKPNKINKKQSENNVLGKGLSALLGDNKALDSVGLGQQGGFEKTLATIRIHAHANQPRQQFDEMELENLAQSIRQHGILQPLLVRPSTKQPGDFELIAGERRWRAAAKAQLHEVPVLIRTVDDREAKKIALIENIQRHDLNAIEEASGYKSLIEEFDYTQAQLAKILGKSRSHLANMIRLLNLPDGVKAMIADGVLAAGQARPLIDHPQAATLAQQIAQKNMSARQVEAMIAALKKPKKPAPNAKDADIKDIEQRLKTSLGLNLNLDFNTKTKKGKITIHFRTIDQFDDILDRLSHNS